MEWLGHELTKTCFFPTRNCEKLKHPLRINQDGKILRGEEKNPVQDGFELVCVFNDSGHSNAYTLIHFHGNGEKAESYTRQALDHAPSLEETCERLKINLLLVEYRGYGDSTGCSTLQSLLEDVELIKKAVTNELKLDLTKLIVMGRSIGSIPAIHFASNYTNIAGLILDSAMGNPAIFISKRLEAKKDEENKELVEKIQQSVHEFINHEEKISKYYGPLLLLHTRDDQILPFAGADLLMKAWAGKNSTDNIQETKTEEYSDYIHTYSREDKTHSECILRLFQIGGHNYIKSCNHKSYDEIFIKFVEKIQGSKHHHCTIS